MDGNVSGSSPTTWRRWSTFGFWHQEVADPSGRAVCGRSLAGFAGSNPARGMGVYLVSVVCCQVEFFASAWSLVQKSPTECGVSEGDRVASIMRRPWPTRGCCAMEKKSTKTLVILGMLHKNDYFLHRSFQEFSLPRELIKRAVILRSSRAWQNNLRQKNKTRTWSKLRMFFF